MKKITLILMSLILVVVLPLIFVGCDNGTYKFIGVIGSDGQTIVKTEDIQDVVTKEFLESWGYLDSAIKLKSKNRFEWSQTQGSEDFNTTTILRGKYKVEENKIIFATSNNGTEENIMNKTHDIVKGKIVVYLDGIFLVYAK